jgi:acetyl-CoA hydrolase
MQILAAEELVFSRFVREGDTVMWGQAGAEPVALTSSLMRQRRSIGKFSAFVGISWSDAVSIEHTDCVTFTSYCAAGRNRLLARQGCLQILPSHYSSLAEMLTAGKVRVDVLLLQVNGPDARGRYSLGVAAEYLVSALAHARTVVVEINSQAPFVESDSFIESERIDIGVPSSRPPLAAPVSKATPTDVQAARNAADLIEDGATLQCGIGTLPEVVVSALGDRKDLGVHTGAFGDALAGLCEAGVISNARKSIDRGVSVAGLLIGGERSYRYVDRNARFSLRSTAYTHNSSVLGAIERFNAINSAIEVDLTGQVNSEVAGGRYVGAVGGALDFARGANRSRGGQSIIVLPSRAESQGRALSRVVGRIEGPVAAARSDAGIFVTEHGVADLRGLTLMQRAAAMIRIAHPLDRPGLEAYADSQVY